MVSPWGTCLHAADGLAQRVLGGAVGDVHGQAGHHRAARHARAGGGIGPVAVGGHQCRCHHPDGLQGDGVADRGAHLGHHGGDGLGQGVDPGVGRHGGGHGVGQQGVDQCDLGPQVGVGDPVLPPGLGVRHHRAARHLGPGARAGRYGHQRHLGHRVGGGVARNSRKVQPSWAHSRAALAVSMTDPPPRATTAVAPEPASARVASSTMSIVGSAGGLSNRVTVRPGRRPARRASTAAAGLNRSIPSSTIRSTRLGAELGEHVGEGRRDALAEADLDR